VTFSEKHKITTGKRKEIKKPKLKTWYFKADSVEEKRKWVNNMEVILYLDR
jgi:hypothetical protein